jgi:hypothetical protein
MRIVLDMNVFVSGVFSLDPLTRSIASVEKREVEKRPLVGQAESRDLSAFDTPVRAEPHQRPAFRVRRHTVGQEPAHLAPEWLQTPKMEKPSVYLCNRGSFLENAYLARFLGGGRYRV